MGTRVQPTTLTVNDIKYINKIKPAIRRSFENFHSSHRTLAFVYAGKTEQKTSIRHAQHIREDPAFVGSSCYKIIELSYLVSLPQARVHPIMSELENYLITLVDAKYTTRYRLPPTHNQRGGGGGGNHNIGDLQKLYICWR